MCRPIWSWFANRMAFEISQRMNGGISRYDQANWIALIDCCYVDHGQVFTTRYQFFISRGKDKVIVSQYH